MSFFCWKKKRRKVNWRITFLVLYICFFHRNLFLFFIFYYSSWYGKVSHGEHGSGYFGWRNAWICEIFIFCFFVNHFWLIMKCPLWLCFLFYFIMIIFLYKISSVDWPLCCNVPFGSPIFMSKVCSKYMGSLKPSWAISSTIWKIINLHSCTVKIRISNGRIYLVAQD